MAADDIYILGIYMTKFGKHTDKDVVDLASEAVLAALRWWRHHERHGNNGCRLSHGSRQYRPDDPKTSRTNWHSRVQRL